MASYVKFYTFVQYLANGSYNCASDTFKVSLSNTAPTASTNTTFSTDITEISAGNGYSAGGTAATGNSSSQSSGTETFALNNVTFTATGTVGPFRYVVLYDSTQSTHNLVAYWDYGSALTLNNGDTFTVQFNGGGSSGTVFTLA